MRKVALTVAAIGLLAIVWALWPRGQEDGGGSAAPVPALVPARASNPARVPGQPAAEVEQSGTPALDRPASGTDGQVEVRVSARGQPKAGARVRLYWRGPMDPNTNAVDWRLAGSATAGSDGIARLPARPGTYLAVARAEGLAPARREVVRPAGEPMTRVDLPLLPGASLRARTTVKRSGEPVPLVEVRLIANGRPGTGLRAQGPAEEQVFANSDARGQARVDGLAPGMYRVEARSVGYARWERDDVEVPSAGELAIALEGAGVLEGFVVDAADQPAEGATVTVIGDEEPVVVTTGPGGGFSAEVVAGTYQLSAKRGTETAALQRPTVAPSGATVRGLKLTLRAGSAIEGKVVAAAGGAPVAGATVAVSPYLKSGDSGRTVSTADGAYAVEGLAPGSYDVVVSAPGYSELSRRGITLAASQRFPLKLELRGTGTVEGTVMDSAGLPVSGAAVREGTRWTGGSLTVASPEARTGPDGRYRLPGVSAGRVRLVARREVDAGAGAMQEVEVREAQVAKADFTLAESGFLEGRVTGKTGGPPTAALRVFAFAQSRGAGWGRTNVLVGADGGYRLELPPGAYSVSVTPADFSGWRSPRDAARSVTTVEAGKTQRLDLTVSEEKPEGTVAGQVVESDGTPSPGAEVQVLGPTGNTFGATDAQGRFSIPFQPASPPVDFPLVVSASNGGRKGKERVPPSGGEVTVRLESSGVLRGRLIAGGGAPVTGFTLKVMGGRRDAMRGEEREFAGDSFELYDVPGGSVRLLARTNDGRRGEAETSISDGEGTLDIPLEQSASIIGRVVDATTRRPLTEGWVAVSGRAEGFARLEADGSFKVTDVPPGDRIANIGAPMRQGVERKASLVAGQVLDLGEVPLETPRAEPGSIGAQLRDSGGQVVLDWLIPDGPAQRAGVRAGDALVAVDGAPVKSIFEASQRVRGAPSTNVMLTVRRSGTEQTLAVSRAGDRG